ncbi:hypothetical protein BDR04DRAFT_1112949 [Suillus decipiens]|nr:hypothetical protein BDR04DRAFT_1112949 [Suillus decipiens]
MGNQGDDEDGEDEVDPPEDVDGDSDDGIVIHDMRCKHCESRDLECTGREGQGCTECRASKQCCSYSRQGVLHTRGKTSASTTAPICKIPVGLKGRAASSRRLRGVHVKFRAIQGLLAEVANEMDMMCAHFNRKARG